MAKTPRDEWQFLILNLILAIVSLFVDINITAQNRIPMNTLYPPNQQETGVLADTGELTLTLPELPKPTITELQAKFPLAQIESIKLDASPTGPVTLKLGDILRQREIFIVGDEYERRLTLPFPVLLLGYQHSSWLEEHQDELPSFKSLLGKIYCDFVGLVVLDAHNNLRSPQFPLNRTCWRLQMGWLANGFGKDGRVPYSA